MTREEAIYRLKALLTMCDFRDAFGDRVDDKLYEDAVAMAIEALKAEPKFTRVTIDTDEGWLNRKLDVFKDRLYLNEKTMIIYVPFVSFELIAQRGGTIKRIGEK